MTGYVYDSAAVRADALNNMTDILVSVAVMSDLKSLLNLLIKTTHMGT